MTQQAAPATFCEFLLDRFRGRLAMDRDGARDWRTSQHFTEGQEEMAFTVLEPIGSDEIESAIRGFYVPKGYEVKFSQSKMNGRLKKDGKTQWLFVVEAMTGHILITVTAH